MKTDTSVVDVPAHAYQLTYESSPRWSSFFAQAPEILQYWKDVAAKYNVRKNIRFETKCIGARWNEETKKWHVQVKNVKTGIESDDSADVLVTGEGVLNEWRWPDIAGIDSFKGILLHSANWDSQVSLKVTVCCPLMDDNLLIEITRTSLSL